MANFDINGIPNQKGRVILVTGANTGLGLETCKILASKGATVVMAHRDSDKSKEALKLVQEIANSAGGKADEIKLDLGDLSSIRAAVDSFKAKYTTLHCLINNAGVVLSPYQKTKDGFEMHFGVNHLGHFALTGLLFPILKKTAASETVRIVNLTSGHHCEGPSEGLLFDNLDWSSGNPAYTPNLAYGHSKYANVVFTKELTRRLGPDSKIICNCANPGFVNTESTRNLETSWFKSLIIGFAKRFMAVDPHTGALTQLYCACSPEIEEKNLRGEYFVPVAKHSELDKKAPPVTLETMKKLWDISESLTGVHYELPMSNL